jgi:tRNA pseudouridine55 synthase
LGVALNAPRRPPSRRVDGVLLLDKPLGLSSNTALQKVRRLFNAAKAGHTGTLDPLASGLLPLCLGEATKFAGELLTAEKSYRATLKFGVTTDTADAEGQVLQVRPVAVDESSLRAALLRFHGEIDQIPPMYSALKRDGKPLYAYAREGIAVERASRRITISAIALVSFVDDCAVIDIDCSKGTYIRVLAEDIGEVLGCGAHLAALRRTRVAQLTVADAVTLEHLESMTADARDAALAPTDALLAALPRMDLDERETACLLHGQAVRRADGVGDRQRIYSHQGRFVGLGELSPDGWLQPRRLVADG